MTDYIKVIDDGSVLEIALNRPDKKNALNSAMYHALTNALSYASANDKIRAVLITAAGDDFCAGNDVADFVAAPSDGAHGFDFISAIATFERPIVAAVQGLAVGVGTTMLFHCDLVYVAPNARFMMPFVKLGLVPEAGSSLLAPAALGYAKAASMLLLGEPLDAEHADRVGFVTDIIPADDLREHARRKAHLLAAQPPTALEATRRLMKGDPKILMTRINEEAVLFREAMQSPEAKDAFAAFFKQHSSSS